jgi:hypothetical protein
VRRATKSKSLEGGGGGWWGAGEVRAVGCPHLRRGAPPPPPSRRMGYERRSAQSRGICRMGIDAGRPREIATNYSFSSYNMGSTLQIVRGKPYELTLRPSLPSLCLSLLYPQIRPLVAGIRRPAPRGFRYRQPLQDIGAERQG